MAFCNSCGNQLTGKERFCAQCGADTSAKPSTAATSVAAAPPTPSVAPPPPPMVAPPVQQMGNGPVQYMAAPGQPPIAVGYPPPAQPTQQKKGMMGTVVAVVIVAALGYYYYTRSHPPTPPVANNPPASQPGTPTPGAPSTPPGNGGGGGGANAALVNQQAFTAQWANQNGMLVLTTAKWTNSSTTNITSAVIQCEQDDANGTDLSQYRVTLNGPTPPNTWSSFSNIQIGAVATNMSKVNCAIVHVKPAS